MPTPRYPALFQVNTRVRLSELSAALGRKASLDDIPDAEIDRLAADDRCDACAASPGREPSSVAPTQRVTDEWFALPSTRERRVTVASAPFGRTASASG